MLRRGKSPRADMTPTIAQTTASRAERPAAALIEDGAALNARMVRTAYQANSRRLRPRQALLGRARGGTWKAVPPHARIRERTLVMCPVVDHQHGNGLLAVNLLNVLAAWCESVEWFLGEHGISMRFGRSPDDGRPKAFRGLMLRRGHAEGELLLWETGEAELNTAAPDGAIAQEHLQVNTLTELAAAIDRLLKAVA